MSLPALLWRLDTVHDGVPVQLGGAREDPVHGDDHGLGAGLRQTLLVHLGLLLAGLPQQGLRLGDEVKCRFRYGWAGRTFGQELVLDTSPDHLSKFQLGNTFENLQPTGPEIVSICVGHRYQSLDSVNVLCLHLRHTGVCSQQSKPGK